MSLPRFIVLKSDHNERYLGYVQPEEFENIDEGVARSRNSFLRFDRDEASTTHTKFEVTPAKCGDRLVHLKSCYNNKYLVRWSARHYWIVAAADQPEEDRYIWSCTLFKPVYVKRKANTVRFLHFQLGHYASLSREGYPFEGCLFGGSDDPDKDSRDVVKFIDWESLSTSTSRRGGSGSDAAVADDNNYILKNSTTIGNGDWLTPPATHHSRPTPDSTDPIADPIGAKNWKRVRPTVATLIAVRRSLEKDFYVLGSAVDQDDDNSTSLPRSSPSPIAIASLKGTDHFNVEGTIAFVQFDPDSVTIITKIKNIPFQFHALHIKTYGDISRGSASSGHTFRDLGNFQSVYETRRLEAHITTNKIFLFGEDSIIGRTIVVYSGPNPNPGKPLAWGVIGILNES